MAKRRGNPKAGAKTAQRNAIAIRRQQVATMVYAYVPQHRIAEQLGVSTTTISKDLKAIRADWQAEARIDIQAAAVRELRSIDALESRLWNQFASDLEPDERTRTAVAILKCKERRAKMLGFDQPDLLDITISDDRLQAELVVLREELGYPKAIEA